MANRPNCGIWQQRAFPSTGKPKKFAAARGRTRLFQRQKANPGHTWRHRPGSHRSCQLGSWTPHGTKLRIQCSPRWQSVPVTSNEKASSDLDHRMLGKPAYPVLGKTQERQNVEDVCFRGAQSKAVTAGRRPAFDGAACYQLRVDGEIS